MRILTVGGGIAGLFAARVLARDGHAVTLVERTPAPTAIGAGLMLSSRALAMLEQQGLAVRGIARPLARLSVLGPDGRVRASVRDRHALTRADLTAALLSGLDEVVEIVYDCAVLQTRSLDDHVEAQVKGQWRSYEVLLGADGLRSTTRGTVAPSVPLRSTGQRCRRAIVLGIHTAAATEMWDGDVRVGIVPLGDGRAYVYLVERGRSVSDALEPARFAHLPARERAAVDAMCALPPQEVLLHELWELERPAWGAGRTLLLGDAAHAMTPDLGLGGAMAIEDGSALGAVLRERDDGWLERYRRRRATRVRAVQLASRRIGQLAHSQRVGPHIVRTALRLQA